jgi:hypothetical protein
MPALSTSTAYDADGLDEPAIPYDWTAAEALAVVNFLEDLADHIWSRYGLAIRGCTLGPPPPLQTRQLALPFTPPWEQGIDMDEVPDEEDDHDIPF